MAVSIFTTLLCIDTLQNSSGVPQSPPILGFARSRKVQKSRLAEGAEMLELDGNGLVVRSFRCALPTVVQGTMVPSGIACWNDSLYLLDARGVLARYIP